MTSLRNVPLSDDKLTDWIFKQLLNCLREKSLVVKRTNKPLPHPESNNISGLTEYDERWSDVLISINASTSANEQIATLIHELCHVLFHKTSERDINKLERILWEKITNEQRDYLRSYLARRKIK